jgi:hypothetical protein
LLAMNNPPLEAVPAQTSRDRPHARAWPARLAGSLGVTPDFHALRSRGQEAVLYAFDHMTATTYATCR